MDLECVEPRPKGSSGVVCLTVEDPNGKTTKQRITNHAYQEFQVGAVTLQDDKPAATVICSKGINHYSKLLDRALTTREYARYVHIVQEDTRLIFQLRKVAVIPR